MKWRYHSKGESGLQSLAYFRQVDVPVVVSAGGSIIHPEQPTPDLDVFLLHLPVCGRVAVQSLQGYHP